VLEVNTTSTQKVAALVNISGKVVLKEELNQQVLVFIIQLESAWILDLSSTKQEEVNLELKINLSQFKDLVMLDTGQENSLNKMVVKLPILSKEILLFQEPKESILNMLKHI